MEQYIFFRSHRIHSIQGESNVLTHKGRGSDFNDITGYINGDDTRDISWKHSAKSNDTILKKKRVIEESFPLYIVQDVENTNGFFTKDNPKSSRIYAKEIVKKIKLSAKKNHFPSHIIEIDDLRKVRNSMVLYITSSLDITEFSGIRGSIVLNDVIVIHIFHPYELDPREGLLFDGYGVSLRNYIKAFNSAQSYIQRYIQSSCAGYLLLTTDMDITLSLNNFFKNRYSK